MDLLDRLLGHDAWTTRLLLERSRALADADLDRPFDIGHQTLRATFTHIIRNMEIWSALMAGSDPSSFPGPNPERPTLDALLARLDVAAARFARTARSVAARDGWDERWLDVLDTPPVEKTFGGAIAHLLTHSMHHRAQVLFMLRQLGVDPLPEGDVLSWEQEHAKEN